MEVTDKLIAIFYSVIILCNALMLRKVVGTWLFPGCLFSLFWFFFTFFPLVVLFEVPVNPNAIAFITAAILLFSPTFLLFNWNKAFSENLNKPDPERVFNTHFLRLTLLISILISVLSSFMHVLAQGFGVIEILTNPVIVASKFASARYADELNYSVFGPISLVFSNISVVMGGLIFGACEIKKNKKILFAFLPSVIILLTQSSKGLFFLSFFLFMGGLLVNKLFTNNLTLFNRRTVRNVILIFFIFVILVAISFLSRGVQDGEDLGMMLAKLRFLFASYLFTHIYGFSDWFTAYTGGTPSLQYDTSDFYMGFYTLMAFFKLLGSQKVVSAGTYDEFFIYNDLLESNIYTIFRGMIMDFGIIGSLVFMVLNGFFIHFIYYLFLRRNRPVLTVILLVFILGYFYMSFMVSMLTWVIIPFTFIICYLILKFNEYDFVIKRTT